MSEGASLEVAIRHRLGALALDVAFRLHTPWTVLFAPSGAGKSTVLRVIAGLVRPDWGQVIWTTNAAPEQYVVLTDTQNGAFVPPHQRAVRFVGQQVALFPHRTVLDNVGYARGRFFRSEDDRKVARERVGELLELCRIVHLAEKMPSMLSGGEKQRVAIARALGAPGCRALLLDEPFSGLDATMRDVFVEDLKVWLSLRGIPVLQVTHDVGEVFALGAEVIRMANGRVVAQGTVHSVLHEESVRLIHRLQAAAIG